MNPNMSMTESQSGELNDERQLAELFKLQCERLTQMLRLRMDPRLQGRIDAADVLQEAYIECVSGSQNIGRIPPCR